MLSTDNRMTLADLLSMQQDNTDPSVQYSTGQPSLSSLTRGRTEEEINKLLSGMQMRTPGFDPNFMAGEPYMPPQAMPQNYVQRGNNAPIDMDQRQPMPQNYIQRGNNAPIDLGQSRRQHDVYADGPELLNRQQQPDGTFLVTKRVPARDGEGRMSSAVRQYIETPDYLNPAKLKEMQFKQAMQKLSEGSVDEQLKRAQLAELMGMDPAQMGGVVAAPVPTQTPGFFPENTAQTSGAQQQATVLNQKMLTRRFGNAPTGHRWDAQGNAIPIPGIDKPLTEFQGKSANFGGRAAAAHEILTNIGDGGNVQPGAIKRVLQATPLIGEGLGTLANITQSAPQQQVEQAQRDFVNAVLRQESGAAIAESEFNNAQKQYFPQPGDTPDVILQKKRNREQAIAGFAVSAGDGGKKLITSAREKTQAIFEAHKAIKQGADKAAVAQRLNSMGITDHGIK